MLQDTERLVLRIHTDNDQYERELLAKIGATAELVIETYKGWYEVVFPVGWTLENIELDDRRGTAYIHDERGHTRICLRTLEDSYFFQTMYSRYFVRTWREFSQNDHLVEVHGQVVRSDGEVMYSDTSATTKNDPMKEEASRRGVLFHCHGWLYLNHPNWQDPTAHWND